MALDRKGPSVLTLRGSGNLGLSPAVIKACDYVADEDHDRGCNVVAEWLNADIEFHGDALRLLRLSGQVVRPTSLQQILRAQVWERG